MFDKFNGTYNGVRIIAEVKLVSPFGKRLTQNEWPEQLQLASMITGVRGMISLHTHPLWHGSLQWLGVARKVYPSKKILAKGFHPTDDDVSRALDAGADAVLVVGRQPKVHADKCWIEPLTLAELATIPDTCPMAVWNSRDLSSLKHLPGIPQFLVDRWKEIDHEKEPFADARRMYRRKLCQASNVKTVADIEPGADAVLVGTHLESFADSLGVRL
jgi:hypothetical protein